MFPLRHCCVVCYASNSSTGLPCCCRGITYFIALACFLYFDKCSVFFLHKFSCADPVPLCCENQHCKRRPLSMLLPIF
ncbi:hypothetical protein FORC31_p450 (plasmid) [Escherichia coli]|nr:hypothetical protein FORC31_p450 [Escherichia coli]